MSKDALTVEVLLDCGHKHMFTQPYPRKGDYLLCRECRESATVIHVDNKDKFSFKCAVCDMPEIKFGRSQMERTRQAQRHVRATQHTVYLLRNGEIERRILGSGYYQPHLIEAQLPPF